MIVFICLFEPKKVALKNGAIPLVIALEAVNKKMASALAIAKLWEAYPAAGDNFADPKVCEDSVGQPRPVVGEFDEQFAQDNTFDGKVWTPNVVASAENEDDNDGDEQGDDSGLVNYAKLGIDVKVGKVLMYDLHDIDTHELSLVYDLINDDEGDAGLRSIIKALTSIPAIGAMYQESVKELIDAINVKFPKIPQFPEVQKFAQKWVDEPGKRDELTGAKKVTRINTPSPDAPIKRGFDHTYKTLDLEVALALVPANFNCWEIHSAEMKLAKELMDSNDDAWRKWSTELRVRSDALSIPRETIFEMIRAGKEKPIFLTDAAARKEFITQCLAVRMPQPAVKNLGDGKFSIDVLVGDKPAPAANSETKLALVANSEPETETKPPVVATEQENPAQEPISDNAAQQAKETLDQLGYGVYASVEDSSGQHAETIQHTPEISTDEFQQRAVIVEEDISAQPQDVQDNMNLWRSVQRTDERFTKAFSNNGGGTSINGTYMVMQATKLLGPQGINWRVEILEERFDNGAPIMRSVKGADGNYIKEIIPNGSGGYLTEINHVIKIRLIYTLRGERGEIPAYGCTPYIYNTKNGLTCDSEVTKKSLTDATKKALSQLGFSADVFLGLFDDLGYRTDNAAEFAIKNASEKAGDTVRLRKELDDKLTKVGNTISNAVTTNEVSKIYGTIAREVDVHRKDAEAKADHEHANYLKTRLLALHRLTEKRVAELTAQEPTA
ncbi:transcription termination factor [Yersinia kristensenii]|uniref:transcription termination factor n=1 Tax=Yersinia kristensenii TaxID=28152 RepID=UPI00119EF071|nr:transcription termination factor [Yersinia kristensenii]